MRRTKPVVFVVSLALSTPLFALSAVSATDVPKATPRLLRELSRQPEAEGVDVIVAIHDGTPSPREPGTLPTELDQAVRARRTEAAQTLADETAAVPQPNPAYESCPMPSVRVPPARAPTAS